MNRSAQTILGTLVAVLGVVIFLQRGYFTQTILKASPPAELELLRLTAGSGDPNSQQLLKQNDDKELQVSVAAGALFVVGSILAVAGASRQGRYGEARARHELKATVRKTAD
jgi:hypothetical protein